MLPVSSPGPRSFSDFVYLLGAVSDRSQLPTRKPPLQGNPCPRLSPTAAARLPERRTPGAASPGELQDCRRPRPPTAGPDRRGRRLRAGPRHDVPWPPEDPVAMLFGSVSPRGSATAPPTAAAPPPAKPARVSSPVRTEA